MALNTVHSGGLEVLGTSVANLFSLVRIITTVIVTIAPQIHVDTVLVITGKLGPAARQKGVAAIHLIRTVKTVRLMITDPALRDALPLILTLELFRRTGHVAFKLVRRTEYLAVSLVNSIGIVKVMPLVVSTGKHILATHDNDNGGFVVASICEGQGLCNNIRCEVPHDWDVARLETLVSPDHGGDKNG